MVTEAAVAIVPYGTRIDGTLASTDTERLIWPRGMPERLRGKSIRDLSGVDHLILYPSTRAWLTSFKEIRANLSLMIVEPRVVHAKHLSLARLFKQRFYRILTHDTELLKLCDRARFLLPASLTASAQASTTKVAMLSIIASAKRSQIGHRLRHSVIKKLENYRISTAVLGRGYQPIHEKSDGLAPFRFSIVIENCQERGYITEKLIDALVCRTVPIYWGAPDVYDWFDPAGLILCNTEEEIVTACRNLTETSYSDRISVIDENRTRALALADLHARAAQVVCDA